MQRRDAHIQNIAMVARQLSQWRTEVVFTGGAIVGLLLTDHAAADVRPTDDVDAIVAAARYSNYALLQDDLRKLGFKHDMDGPNCRFILHGLKVDIMPSEGRILGFTNSWYDYAIKTAVEYVLPDGTAIRLISAPAFIATKLEAFYDRGKGDVHMSHDLEDIIAVVNGRAELTDEIRTASTDVRQYICESFTKLLDHPGFSDAVAMQLMPDEGSQARSRIIIERIRSISKLSNVID